MRVILLVHVHRWDSHNTESRVQIRIPTWTQAGRVRLLLDGSPTSCTVAPEDNGGYCSLVRSFRTGLSCREDV